MRRIVVCCILLLGLAGLWPEAAARKARRTSWRLRELRNLRDANLLAGLPARRIYRSDDPRHRPHKACERLRALSIRTIVKLNAFQHRVNHRRVPIWRKGPCGIPELAVSLPYGRTEGAHGLSIYHVARNPLSAKRRRVVRYMRRQLAFAFRELSKLKKSQLPVLIHCSAGRDRTGIVVAMLQRLAGAPRLAVEREYLASLKTVGHVSVISLRKVLRVMGPMSTFMRNKLGLTWWELYRLKLLVRGRRARAPASPRAPSTGVSQSRDILRADLTPVSGSASRIERSLESLLIEQSQPFHRDPSTRSVDGTRLALPGPGNLVAPIGGSS